MARWATLVMAAALVACEQPGGATDSSKGAATVAATPDPAMAAPAEATHPPVDPTNIVSIAVGSKDHTTLVAALKAADYVDSVSNAGPMTVFAPTNAAFARLPAGTVDGLLKPEKAGDLREVLKYHVAVSTYTQKDLHDGQKLGMANGKNVVIHVKDGKVMVNDATILASIPASNGIVHVIDGVLLPPAH